MNQVETPQERRAKFDAAFNSILNTNKTNRPNWIAGLQIVSSTDYVVTSPIDHSIQFGRYQRSEVDLPQVAMPKLIGAFEEWSSIPIKDRLEYLRNAITELERQRYRIAAAVSISAGMTATEAMFEVERLLRVLRSLERECEVPLFGSPTGVWAVFSSYNSPLAGPMAYALAAAMAGNVVFLLPAHECPFPCYMVYDLLAKSGFSKALSLATDPVGDMRRSLMNHPDLAGIVVCGSGETVDDAMFVHVDEDLGFILEAKGMNPALISRYADMSAAASMVCKSAFSYTGQRLDACSKVVVLEPYYEEFLNCLLKAVVKFRVGDPAERDVCTGPLISKERTQEFLALASDLKDNIVYGGERLTDGYLEDGEYVSPAILVGLDDNHEFNVIDHSLPFLSVQVATDLQDAIEKINMSETGLSGGIFTDDPAEKELFMREVKADVIYLNSSSNNIAPGLKAAVSAFLV